jgi:putative transposase
MGNYATKIVYHIVLSVLGEENVFSQRERHRMNAILYRHFRREGFRPLAQMCEREHLHALVQGNASVSLQRLVHRAKTVTARWVNKRRGPAQPFFWRREYLAFTVAPVAIARAREFVITQDAIHQRKSFNEECAWILGEGADGNPASALHSPSTNAAAVSVPEPAAPLA